MIGAIKDREPMELIHTCYRVTDPERSIAFYEALGLEKRRELPIRDEAVNYLRT
jgi:catechol 2,3-dioxygenase-like lactoylglutathione lyase family enzyme